MESHGEDGKHPCTANLVEAKGNLWSTEIPIGVAKLMLEAPSHPMALAEEVVRTQCMSDLWADEKLRPEELYLLLSVEQIGSKLSNQQMAVIVGAVKDGRRKGKKGYGSGNRVFSKAASRKEEEKKGGKKGFLDGKFTKFLDQRIGGYRQWRPVLDTIHESN
uniref:Uncharacterized protein LOC105060140 n=1 Tax=Elaeis guineensis var. tenera TaxID=51953 RepID=A0A6I9SF77_ELAGV|nr:uncharacterized protein LOC105060140 [Elaeis guineensis]